MVDLLGEGALAKFWHTVSAGQTSDQQETAAAQAENTPDFLAQEKERGGQVEDRPDNAHRDNDAHFPQPPKETDPAPTFPKATNGALINDAARRFLCDYDVKEDLAQNVYGINAHIRDLSVLLTLNDSKNVLIYGPAGVGKSEILHGLVAASRAGATSLDVSKRAFLELDAEALLADDDIASITRNVREIVRSLERREYVVFIIDNAWNFFECLTNKGAYGAIYALMSGIAGRKFQSIMVVKDTNFKKIVDLHPIFKEAFTSYKIDEQSPETTLHTLRSKQLFYQRHFGIVINDEAIRTIADLSVKYPTSYARDLALPGRAVRLLEFVCASYRNAFMSKPQELVDLETRYQALDLEKRSLKDENPDRTAELDDQIGAFQKRLAELQEDWNGRTKNVLDIVKQKHVLVEKLERVSEELERERNKRRTDGLEKNLERQASGYREKIGAIDKNLKELNIGTPSDHPLDDETVNELFSAFTGISLSSLRQSALERILTLETSLSRRIIGQGYAVHTISDALKNHAAGMTGENRPIGSFFLIGPTGVGKTELGMALDEYVTGIPGSQPIVFNMTEFKEQHTVATLLGAPPGYAGEDKGGLLINYVRDKHRGVLIFDEIEKAHPDIFDVLMPIMDKAVASARSGEEARFNDFIVLATSNIGAHLFMDPSRSFEEAKNEALSLLHQTIRPEILGRFNDIIFFQSLPPDVQFLIAKKFLTSRNQSLLKQKFEIAMTDKDLTDLCERYYDPKKGGRSLRNVFEKDIASLVSSIILTERLKASRSEFGKDAKAPPGGVVSVSLEPNGNFKASFTSRKKGLLACQIVGGSC